MAHVWHWSEWLVDVEVYCVKQFVGIIVWGFCPQHQYNIYKLFYKGYHFFSHWHLGTYNEFTENITKESDPVQQKHYTTKKAWLVDVINIFWFILILFLFQRRYLISANIIHTDLRIRTFHIRFLYQHFLSGITEKSLIVFYYACSYAKVDYFRFMNILWWLLWSWYRIHCRRNLYFYVIQPA